MRESSGGGQMWATRRADLPSLHWRTKRSDLVAYMALVVGSWTNWVLYSLLAIVGVLVVFRMLTFVSKKRNRITPQEFEQIIERHIAGTELPGEWEHFTSIPIADNRLIPFLQRCIDIGGYPLTEWRIKELRDIVADLRKLGR